MEPAQEPDDVLRELDVPPGGIRSGMGAPARLRVTLDDPWPCLLAAWYLPAWKEAPIVWGRQRTERQGKLFSWLTQLLPLLSPRKSTIRTEVDPCYKKDLYHPLRSRSRSNRDTLRCPRRSTRHDRGEAVGTYASTGIGSFALLSANSGTVWGGRWCNNAPRSRIVSASTSCRMLPQRPLVTCERWERGALEKD